MNIDWDSSLLQALARMPKAVTKQHFQQIIENLLSNLKDPNSECLDMSNPSNQSVNLPSQNQEQPSLLHTEGEIYFELKFECFNFVIFSKNKKKKRSRNCNHSNDTS